MLAGLADALQVRIRDLVTLPAADERALVRFRDPLRAVTSASSAVNALVDFGRYYRLLELRSGKKFRSRSVPPIAIEELSDKEHAATDLALAERARLNLGDGPLLDVRAVLEQDAGVLVFGLRSLEAKVAGLFTYSLDLPLVGFNLVESDVRRQRWTLAHEYAHFLTNRYDAEITYEGRKSRDAHEVFADRFATHFLMPASGVSRRLSEIIGGGERATVAHVLLLAYHFKQCANGSKTWVLSQKILTITLCPVVSAQSKRSVRLELKDGMSILTPIRCDTPICSQSCGEKD